MQGSHDICGEAEVLDFIIDMSNARALAFSNIMNGMSVRESTETIRSNFGEVYFYGLGYRVDINGASVREYETIVSTGSYARVFLNSVFSAEIQDIMNMMAPRSVVPDSGTPAYLEIAVTRTEAHVPVVVEYNTTQNDIFPVPEHVGVVPHYGDDPSQYYGSY